MLRNRSSRNSELRIQEVFSKLEGLWVAHQGKVSQAKDHLKNEWLGPQFQRVHQQVERQLQKRLEQV